MRYRARLAAALAFLSLSGCSSLRIVENNPAAVTVRYDGIVQTLSDATAVAEKRCGRYGKSAKLRKDEHIALSERFAHFDCVGR